MTIIYLGQYEISKHKKIEIEYYQNSPIKFSHNNASKMFVYLQFHTLKIEKKSQGHYSGTTHVKIKIVKSLN